MPLFHAPAFCGQSGRQVPVEDVLSRGLADRPGGHGDGGGGVGVGEEEEEEEEEEVLSVGLVGVKWRRGRMGRDEAWSMDTCALGQVVTNCRCSRRRRRRRTRKREGGFTSLVRCASGKGSVFFLPGVPLARERERREADAFLPSFFLCRCFSFPFSFSPRTLPLPPRLFLFRTRKCWVNGVNVSSFVPSSPGSAFSFRDVPSSPSPRSLSASLANVKQTIRYFHFEPSSPPRE